jgi:multimeric flavodoxin WrbA
LLFLCFVLFRSFFFFLFCWICSTMHMMMTPAEEGARESGAEERMIHVYACHGKLASFTITCHSHSCR